MVWIQLAEHAVALWQNAINFIPPIPEDALPPRE
jgi:hypothetical protein